ncbi:hypothetical protein ACSXBY_10155 [Clostridium perfringens]|uniref:Transposon-encoded protein TnpW n=2 Tax=Bacillota TaxID=1239 RepID=A0AAW9I3N7_CLOPF|nr:MULTISPECIES: hypothetical protein [Bacillota]CAI3336857.1 hypothetical protein CIRMBP1320_00309 [Enterococcus cecorum]EDS78927.1 hypothetical protein CPC_2573 [Clostridium perfringens C str. JGS1495]ELC8422299.1 hypothetical protein [Clostridium perfringens]MBI6027250.1 hypothetical protein [Clostridium perfringens]MBI6028306.1 hypothetical protein [Clostridium perfringens]
MKIKERNPPIKEYVKQVGNTIFTVKSLESTDAKQPIKLIIKKILENKIKT